MKIAPILLALSAGCTTEGFRADGGGCPLDEVCSDETPYGLRFAGTRFAGDWLFADPGVKMIAEGGSQTVEVRENDIGETPLSRPFSASMDGSGWSVLATEPPEVQIAAAAEGVGYLRIADPDTDELYDKVDVQSRRVERAELWSNQREVVSDDAGWLMHVGEDRQVYVDLRSPGDDRLADESLVIEGDGAQVAWDVFSIDRAEPGSVTLEAVTGGGDRFELVVEFVDAIDGIAVDGEPETELEAGSSTFYCFRAAAGAATVYGMEWSFQASGVVTLADDPTALADNCAWVETDEIGQGSLLAEAGGHVVELGIEVVEPSAARAAPRSPARSFPLTPGLRAR
jgi:hypothetical protein